MRNMKKICFFLKVSNTQERERKREREKKIEI